MYTVKKIHWILDKTNVFSLPVWEFDISGVNKYAPICVLPSKDR